MDYNKNIKDGHNKDIGEIIFPDDLEIYKVFSESTSIFRIYKYFQDIFTEFRVAMKKSDRRRFKG